MLHHLTVIDHHPVANENVHWIVVDIPAHVPALHEDAARQGAGARASARRRMAVGVVGVVVGLALVLVGVNTTMWIGAIGFAVMVSAVAFALTPPRRKTALGTVQSDGSVRRSTPASRCPRHR